jgi:hypothetical protein
VSLAFVVIHSDTDGCQYEMMPGARVVDLLFFLDFIGMMQSPSDVTHRH